MKFTNKLIILLIFVCVSMFGMFCQAQTTPPPAPVPNPIVTTPFSIAASLSSLSSPTQTSPAADVGFKFAITNNLIFRQENILSPGNAFQGYFGGFDYPLSFFNTILSKTNLPPTQYQFYGTGSIGAAISGTSTTQTHFAGMIGGGLKYSPTKNGQFNINLFEARYAKFPGFNNSTVIVSSGVGWNF